MWSRGRGECMVQARTGSRAVRSEQAKARGREEGTRARERVSLVGDVAGEEEGRNIIA